MASLDDKKAMFMDYSTLLNSLDSGATAKLTIHNHRMSRSTVSPVSYTHLDVYKRQPQCSVGNDILIAAQKPEATCYRTYEDWSKENISIRRGEKCFSMLVPDGTYTGKDGKAHINFDVQKVFDISQTNAVPKASMPGVRQNLQALLMRPVCPVQVVDQQKGAVCVPDGNRVEIGRGLSMEESVRTLTMALAHGELAKTIPDYNPGAPQNSFYARCISYVVCVCLLYTSRGSSVYECSKHRLLGPEGSLSGGDP